MSVPPTRPRPAPALMLLWLATAAAAVWLYTLPVLSDTEVLLPLAALLGVLVLRPFASVLWPRLALLAMASLPIAGYLLWRVGESLPPPSDRLDFALGLVLLGAESFTILTFFFSAFVAADPRRTPPAPRLSPADLPRVDVLVPSYNEPAAMLAVTLAAARRLDYPRDRLRVILCDDGGTDARCADPDPAVAAAAHRRRRRLMALCQELGAEYMTRSDNRHAKAGNLQAALKRLSGELVVVFDSDHVPTRDFLSETVGHFAANPRLFLVQTPHFFLNRDPVQRNLGLPERCPPENEMFYARILPGLDRWGGAMFCGSAAVLRRAALDEVGGFLGETVTEDAETTLALHAAGWQSLYVDRPMIAGLEPESFMSFIRQRGRWGTGMMQLLILKGAPFRRGLSLSQRLCYLNSVTFWFFPLTRIIFLVAPLAFLLFGVELLRVPDEGAHLPIIAYFLAMFLTQNALFGRERWPLVSEVYETAQAPYLLYAIAAVLLRPRGARFKVTGKDETLARDFFSPLFLPLFLLFLAMLGGLVATILHWQNSTASPAALTVIGGWNLLNLVITSAALGAVVERRQRRVSPRIPVVLPAEVVAGAAAVPATILDLSAAGIMLRISAEAGEDLVTALEPGQELEVWPAMPQDRGMARAIRCRLQRCRVTVQGFDLGVAFLPEQPAEAQALIAAMAFADSGAWARLRMWRNRRLGIVPGVLLVLFVALRVPLRALSVALRELMRLLRGAELAERWDDPLDAALPIPGAPGRGAPPATVREVA